VRLRGLEPPRDCSHTDLNRARLPIFRHSRRFENHCSDHVRTRVRLTHHGTYVRAFRASDQRGSSAPSGGTRRSTNREPNGLPTSTVRDWLAGKLPRQANPDRCPDCGGNRHDFAALPDDYVYLLGLYLGDGCLSAHARSVFKLRIVLDTKYPGIIAEAVSATGVVIGAAASGVTKPNNCVEVYAYSKTWPCLFPQHGPGRKHEREIELWDWQVRLVKHAPESFLRGLVQSDGCRFENTGRDGWRAPRYSFSNVSEDIRILFCWRCELLDLRWTESRHTIYVSRTADVARMDEFIGPKR
jgi:hypothetical protein